MTPQRARQRRSIAPATRRALDAVVCIDRVRTLRIDALRASVPSKQLHDVSESYLGERLLYDARRRRGARADSHGNLTIRSALRRHAQRRCLPRLERDMVAETLLRRHEHEASNPGPLDDAVELPPASEDLLPRAFSQR